MDLGFETIGNATITFFDKVPVLTTDPWLKGSAYFGSWNRSHVIPEIQMSNALGASHVWVSHGHPDHLSADSLHLFIGKKILIPDHRGSRIADGLKDKGHDVHVMSDRKWYAISDRIRVMSIADPNQDAILAVRIADSVVLNLNDARDYTWVGRVRRIIARARRSYLLRLTGYGDADMLNVYREDGSFIPPLAQERLGTDLGPEIARMTDSFGADFFIPSSSMHVYQREDSVWANEFATPLNMHGKGYKSPRSECLPGFVRVQLPSGDVERIEPPAVPEEVFEPEAFGDVWSDDLESDDKKRLTSYIERVSHLGSIIDFVRFKSGNVVHEVKIGSGWSKGVEFECPRSSLMKAVEYEVFDDLLIGNYMKTRFIGAWQEPTHVSLYPHISPFIAKIGDNGRAFSPSEIECYFADYRSRSYFDWLTFVVSRRLGDLFQSARRDTRL